MVKKDAGRTRARRVSLKADVEIQRPEDGSEDAVALYVKSQDGSDLTGNQILEAVAEALLLYWENCPIEVREDEEFDA